MANTASAFEVGLPGTAETSAPQRSAGGVSLVEVMVAAVLLTYISAAIASLLVMNNMANQRLQNKVSNIDSSRMAMERIGTAFRMARSVGDIYGFVLPPSQQFKNDGPTPTPSVDPDELREGRATLSSSSFPSEGDPNWAGKTPDGGWPMQDNCVDQQAFPYRLSTTTLVVQVPVFNQAGYPQMLTSASHVVNIENVNTYVYRIMRDQEKSGQYILQVAGFPGEGVTDFSTPTTATTILKGIIGPLDTNGNLNVFHYIPRGNPSNNPQPVDSINDTSVKAGDISGLIVNIEVFKDSAGANQPSKIALKSEYFMRNNVMASVIGR